MKPTSMPLRAVILGAAVAFAAVGAQAKTFTWTSASDIPTWDSHSQNNALANGIHALFCEWMSQVGMSLALVHLNVLA